MKAPSLQLIQVLETPAFRPDFPAPVKASDSTCISLAAALLLYRDDSRCHPGRTALCCCQEGRSDSPVLACVRVCVRARVRVFSCAFVLSWRWEERWPEVTACSDSSDNFEIPSPLNLKGHN